MQPDIIKLLIAIVALYFFADATPITLQQENVYQAERLGIDCSGQLDSSNALQNAINAMPDAGTIKFPINCKMLLGTDISTGQCALTISDRVGVQFVSDVLIGNFGGGQTPQILWAGHGGKALCFNHSDHPRVIGLSMQVTGSGNYDSCIVFDGNPVKHIGTGGYVDYFVCDNGNNKNANFVGIAISPTATNNHENYEISHSYFGCSGSAATVRARDGVTTSGSPNISSATASFTPDDVGQPINVSYPGQNLQTTVKTFTNSTHIVLNADVPESATNVTIIIGQSYGIAIQNGPSQNALQQTFSRITYNHCHIGVNLAGGNAELSHINGGYSDIGIFVGGFVAQQVSIAWYEAENDLRGIDSLGPLVMVQNSRLSNGQQYGDGFFRFGGLVNIQNSFTAFTVPIGSVLIGRHPNNNPTITSISNQWAGAFGANTWTLLGYGLINQPPPAVINDLVTFGTAPGQFIFGCWLLQGNPCVQVSNIAGHAGNAALHVASSNFYSDSATPIVGIQISGTFLLGKGSVGSYVGLSTSPGTAGATANQNLPMQIEATAPATLGACSGSDGGIGVVTGSGTQVWGAIISGSGSSPALAYCDGKNWTVVGK